MEAPVADIKPASPKKGTFALVALFFGILTLVVFLGGFVVMGIAPCGDFYPIYSVPVALLSLIFGGIGLIRKEHNFYSRFGLWIGIIFIVLNCFLLMALGPGGCPRVNVPNNKIVSDMRQAQYLIDEQAGSIDMIPQVLQTILGNATYQSFVADVKGNGGDLKLIQGSHPLFTLYSKKHTKGFDPAQFYCLDPTADGIRVVYSEPTSSGCAGAKQAP